MSPHESAFTDTLISREVRERIVLVGVTFPHATVADTEAGLDELALLVDTAGADVMDRVMQRREAIAYRGWLMPGGRSGPRIYSESVLLPLGPDGESVDHILIFSTYASAPGA